MYILSIDQGTTGTRAFIFDQSSRVVASAYQEFKQYYPQAGWVEHDADEIWRSCERVIGQALRRSGIKQTSIAAIGITNQRETTVVWDRKTSKPVARAICWQCRRTTAICQNQNVQRHKRAIQQKTGLVVDPYFSATKIQWLLDQVKGLRKKANQGDVCFGTIDSWLVWKLTGGKNHVTDLTNASRTMIFNIKNFSWDKELLRIFKIPSGILPKVQKSGSIFGHTQQGVAGLRADIPIAAILGDQQAALYGQGCYSPGSVKNTYGTGCFVVLNTGKELVSSKQGLLSTIASDAHGNPIYALEGSVFIAGAVMQWLRDELKVIKSATESQKYIQGLKDTHGVYFVPAFAGLGAPYWDSQARGIITGLTRGANVRHVVRAALESIAYQTKDVVEAMRKETKLSIKRLKVDGGACHNDFLMQFQADILNCQVARPKITESTAFGAALLAGVTIGLWKSDQNLSQHNPNQKIFRPRMKAGERDRLYQGWQRAVTQARTPTVL